MLTIVDALPNELLTLIFSYLGTRDIASSRQVCKIFRACSSQFLVTRVVFARRRKALDSLRHIIEHPIFSKTAKELIYDVSTYNRELDGDFDKYEVNVTYHPFRTIVHDERNTLMKSFREYSYLVREEQEIRKTGEDITVLSLALTRLLNLQSVVFGDYATIAPEGLTLQEVQHWLVGQYQVEPDGLFMLMLREGWRPWEEFTDLLRLVSLTGAHVESFSVADNPYEYEASSVPYTRVESHRVPLKCFNPGHCPEYSHLIRVFRTLKRLRLPWTFENMENDLVPLSVSANFLPAALASAVNLTHLMIASGSVLRYHVCLEAAGLASNFGSLGAMSFGQFFGRLTFPKLVECHLENYSFTVDEFTDFTHRHSSTLRELRLFYCETIDASATLLANLVHSTVQLTGVELGNIKALPDAYEGTGVPELLKSQEDRYIPRQVVQDETELESLFLGGARNHIHREWGPRFGPTNAHE